MSLNNPKSGYGNTSEFVTAGLPWVKSKVISDIVVKYSFPRVTKSITISNLNSAATNLLRIAFTENGINGVEDDYYMLVGGGNTIVLDARVKELFLLRNDATDIKTSVYAALTTIEPVMMPILTGSIGGVSFWEGIG